MSRTRTCLPFFAVALLAFAGCGGSSNSTGSGSSNFAYNPAAGSSLAVATVGSSYSQTIQITSGGTPPFVFTLVSGPAGLTLAAVDSRTETLSGTPTTAGLSVVRIQVNDSLNHTTLVSYQIQVDAASSGKLTMTPTTLPNATRPQPYSQFLTVNGGIAPFAWSSSGSLPPGIALGASTSATDQLSGTPTTAGSFSFTVSVSDSSQPPRTVSQALTLKVN